MRFLSSIDDLLRALDAGFVAPGDEVWLPPEHLARLSGLDYLALRAAVRGAGAWLRVLEGRGGDPTIEVRSEGERFGR